jgi:uncharacterized membrane protein YdjX (TVP38/TMEM64 family)
MNEHLTSPKETTPPLPIPWQERVRRNWRTLVLAGVALGAAALAAWQWGETVVRLLSDEATVEAIVAQAGIWGPLALVALNVFQIVVAPVPGYVVQLAAGYLYGPLWGGIYAGIGILLGGMIAMALARTFGRPLARVMVGEERLARWESVTHSDSPWVWFLLFLGPVGDLPFFLAGLSRVSYLTVFLVVLVVRVPTAFLSTAIGAGAVPIVWLGVLIVGATLVMLLLHFYRAPLKAWYECNLARGARTPERTRPAESLRPEPVPVEPACDEPWP